MPDTPPEDTFEIDGLDRDQEDFVRLDKLDINKINTDAEDNVPQYDNMPTEFEFIGPPAVEEHMTPFYYTDGSIDGRIDWDMGNVVMPVCGPIGTPPIIILVHSPFAKRSVEFTQGRFGIKPRIPSSNTKNNNDVILNKTIFTNTPGMNQQGFHIHRSSGRYEYVFIVPPTNKDILPVGTASYDATNPYDIAIKPDDFQDRMLDNSLIKNTDLLAEPDIPGFSKFDLVGP